MKKPMQTKRTRLFETQKYRDKAKEAAEQEKSQNFAKAAELWKEAELIAELVKNRYWAKSRAAFCYRNAINPFETLQEEENKELGNG